MKRNNLQTMMRTSALLLSIVLFLIFSFSTYAEDSVESLEGTTSDLQNELSNLNSELSKLSTELNSIISQIEQATADIKQTQTDLANAKGAADAQYISMKKRIKYIYENGNTSLADILFSASSMSDLLNKADFIASISEYDQKQLDKLVETRDAVAEKEKELQQEKETLSALKANLDQKEADLTNKISSTSTELSQYSDLLQKAKDREKAAQDAINKEVKPTPPPAPNPDHSNNESTNPRPPVKPNANDVELLAALIECEAGSTDYEGMLAVGSVVINRKNHRSYPDTIHGVIYQSGQFAPVRTGKLDKVLERGAKLSCFQAARDAISGKNNVGSCLNFRSADTGHAGTVIGGNVFF